MRTQPGSAQGHHARDDSRPQVHEPGSQGGTAPKEEESEDTGKVVQRKAPKSSSQTTRSSTRSSTAAASSKTASAESTPASGSTQKSSKKSPGGKRARDADDGSSDAPRVSASQPLPQPKRARRSDQPPPPATQPLPATPAREPPSFLEPAPPSSARSKGKAKQKPAPVRKRSENFWHLDGSVVLQVQNTLFRLHRSRLTQQSAYFVSLFQNRGDGSRDSPATVGVERDMVDSCPVYVVKGVSVLDFERLLTALDAGIAYAINPPPFNVLASLVRAAHTLSFPTVLSFATHLLREMWPTDLDKLEEVPEDDDEEAAGERVERAIETILLAQQCDLSELLKAAYFELLRTPDFGQDLDVYLHGESSESPSASTEEQRLKMATEDDEANAPPARLAASDLVRLLQAKQALDAEWLAITRAPPLPSKYPCPLAQISPEDRDAYQRTEPARKQCARAQRSDETRWTHRLLDNGVFDAGRWDVLEGLRKLAEWVDWKARGYCVGCIGERREAWMEKREELWRKLDVLLGLKEEEDE
ncbi:hypothetical protein BV20DRAFT_958139 [Pilatotrama ljubarskyi]|nr:hypothetical protein BV20DRAFT_958139 [Pilatotrama ljubarskyi]